MTSHGPLFEPRRCRCGAVLKPRQRRCCSRRCALQRGFTQQSINARQELRTLLDRAPRLLANAAPQIVHEYLDLHERATRALNRRAGWRVCGTWIAELRKAAGT